MAIKNSWSSGEVLTAADLTDTMKGVSINAQTGTSYTFSLTDGFVTLSNSSGGTATIPTNTTAAFNTGAVIGVMNAGTAGSFVIAPAATVTLNAVSGTTTLAPLESATLVKLGTNTWQLSKGGGLPKATYSSTTGSPTVDTTSRPGKTIVTFTGSGSITISQAGTVEMLLVGAGGAGGSRFDGTNGCGGGGAGAHVYDAAAYLTAVTHTVTVGAGGAIGLSGETSRCGSYLASGGGNGGDNTAPGGPTTSAVGNNGGSGGGGSGGAAGLTGGAGLSGVGNNGGTGSTGEGGAGGGGAGAAGSNGSAGNGGNGGNGTASSITGTSVTRAAGGGGGAYNGTAGTGGTGGGGNGAKNGTNGTNGSANTGSGGGGGADSRVTGATGTGGSGTVILVFG